jgi:hypothetical protein
MRIFLSYRREDSSAWAGRLRDALADRFGERNIFQDVVAVGPGEDFTEAINRALGDADATLAVIGPTWVTVTGPDGTRRLDETDDYVRAELGAALERGVRVIPVLVGGAEMPHAAGLPAELEPLAQRQAVVLRDATWHQDVDGLVRALRGDQPRARRRRWPIAAGVAGLLLAAVGVVAFVLRDGDGSDDDSITGCPTPAPPDWSPIGVQGTPRVQIDGPDGTWITEVSDGQQRLERSPQTVLAVSGTNDTGNVLYHEPFTYELVVDGIEFPPVCFTVVAGNEPLDPGSRDEAFVGFDAATEPATSALALDVAFGDQTKRVSLNGVDE